MKYNFIDNIKLKFNLNRDMALPRLSSTPQSVAIEEINLKVTSIESYSRGSAFHPTKNSTATGFFVKKGEDTYLITNRHVVINEEKEYYPDFLKITIHNSTTTLTSIRKVEIPLYNEGTQLWLEHNDNIIITEIKEKIDLVAIKITNYLQPTDVINHFTYDDLPTIGTVIALGDPCLVIGFPYSFQDETHFLPIARSGTVASTWRSFFRGKKLFLLDSILHPGTSGSPVLIPEASIRRTATSTMVGEYFPPLLIGIQSGEYPGLNLNAIWYSFLIEEIIP